MCIVYVCQWHVNVNVNVNVNVRAYVKMDVHRCVCECVCARTCEMCIVHVHVVCIYLYQYLSARLRCSIFVPRGSCRVLPRAYIARMMSFVYRSLWLQHAVVISPLVLVSLPP